MQSRDILAYDIVKDEWSRLGEWPAGIATAPAVTRGNEIITISGETAPGVRTPVNASATAGYHFEMSTVDYAVLILTVIVLAIIIISAVRNGVRNVSAVTDPNTRPGLWAWVAVIVLWFVVMLNYFDRQLLSALHEPIVRDIPQTEAQFGMVTSVFLLIYALLSPVGGFLADRYSRRLMILCSLVVWSVVTWWTGHAEDYTSLLIARGAMGISEAFYIPAALALITDYHRGSTRSIATGLHMSGIYVGMAIAGFGATMASWTGWRMTFALFGLIGVAYAIVLILFLKDPGQGARGHGPCPEEGQARGRNRIDQCGQRRTDSKASRVQAFHRCRPFQPAERTPHVDAALRGSLCGSGQLVPADVVPHPAA